MADPKGPGAMSPGALFDVHCAAEFVTHDVDATMATMSDHPHITNVPTMTGGLGHEAVRQFYDNWFVGHLPDDWTVELLSRTESKDQVVDEVIASFTHNARWSASCRAFRPPAAR